jgi:hypothetical protein
MISDAKVEYLKRSEGNNCYSNGIKKVKGEHPSMNAADFENGESFCRTLSACIVESSLLHDRKLLEGV